jgi:hypothetical protein
VEKKHSSFSFLAQKICEIYRKLFCEICVICEEKKTFFFFFFSTKKSVKSVGKTEGFADSFKNNGEAMRQTKKS